MAASDKKPAPAPKSDQTVKALEDGYYDGIYRRRGDVFVNTLGLKTKGEGPDFDPNAWFEASNQKPPADDLA